MIEIHGRQIPTGLHRAGLMILEAYRAIVVDSHELLAVWSGPAG